MVTEWLLCFVVVLVIEFFRRRRENFKYFEKLNIDGPAPHILWGHYKQLRADHAPLLKKWSQEYGENFGMFWGDKPMLVTKDLDLVQKVLVKDFTNFINRSAQFALEAAHPINSDWLTNQKGDRWKKLRSLITPAFTSSKMKVMTPQVLKGAEHFLENIEQRRGSSFDVYPLLKRLTVDNIGRTACGIDANTQADPDSISPLLQAALQTMDLSMTGTVDLFTNSFSFIGSSLSGFVRFLFKHQLISHSSNDMCVETEKIVKARTDGLRKNDLLQNLVDARDVSTDLKSLMASGGLDDAATVAQEPSSKSKLKLTHEQLIANTLQTFIAGYETTSTGLAYVFYCLGKHQDVQEKLRQEVIDVLGENGEVEYQKAMNIKYMDQVISESLRLYPPVTAFVTRVVHEATTYKDLKLPAGLSILIPVAEIHRDPNTWPEPERFDPERFSTENRLKMHPMSYLAFGDGPRNCVGMRLALMSMRLILCTLLRKYRITSEHEINTVSHSVITRPKQVRITVKKL